MDNLTKREKDVLKYILQGFTNKEVGEQMHISVETVKIHTKNIYKKLGAKTVFRQL